MKSMLRILGLAIAFAALIGMGACGRSAPTPSPSTLPPNTDPVIVVTFDGGMGDPKIRISCIRLAVWDDGTVLTCTDPLLADRAMAVGNVDPAVVQSALGDLDAQGFFVRQPTWSFPPDSQNYKILARSRGQTRAHGAMTLDQQDPVWWAKCGAAVTRIVPEDPRPVAEVATDGVFRGYVIEEWYRTPWAHPK